MGKMTIWGMIDARPIFFPNVADEVNGVSLQFAVPTEAARSLLAGDAFEIVESAPGTCSLVVAALDFRRGEWGESQTFDIALMVRPVGGGGDDIGMFMAPAPMSPTFGREAVHRALGLPKVEGEVKIGYTGDAVTFRVEVGGASDVVLRLPRVRSGLTPVPVPMILYSYVGGEPYATPLDLDMFTGVVDPGQVEIELGAGPLADTFRRLGLPKAPEVVLWGEGLTAVFYLPERLGPPGDPEAPGTPGAPRPDRAAGVEPELRSPSR